MNARGLIFLVCNFASIVVAAQPNYKSISVCHDKEKKLRNVSVGNFSANLRDGMLVSLSCIDSTFAYHQETQTFVIRNNKGNNAVNIQLTSSGIVCSDSDTSFIIRTRADMKNTVQFSVTLQPFDKSLPASAAQSDVTGECIMNEVAIAAKFVDKKFRMMLIPVGNRILIIERVGYDEPFTYDISITENKKNLFLLQFDQANPSKIRMYDVRNDVGVLLAGNKNGFFDTLLGYYNSEKNIPVYTFHYKLDYDKLGKLKTKHTEFNLECVSE